MKKQRPAAAAAACTVPSRSRRRPTSAASCCPPETIRLPATDCVSAAETGPGTVQPPPRNPVFITCGTTGPGWEIPRLYSQTQANIRAAFLWSTPPTSVGSAHGTDCNRCVNTHGNDVVLVSPPLSEPGVVCAQLVCLLVTQPAAVWLTRPALSVHRPPTMRQSPHTKHRLSKLPQQYS